VLVCGLQNGVSGHIVNNKQDTIVPAHFRLARNIFLWGCRAERGGGGAFIHHEFLIK